MTDTSTDVTDVRPGHSLNLPSLTTYLQQHIPNFLGPIAVKQFGHGQSNPTFLITDTSTQLQYVMRKRPPGKIVSKTAHRVDREYKVMQALFGKYPRCSVCTGCPPVRASQMFCGVHVLDVTLYVQVTVRSTKRTNHRIPFNLKLQSHQRSCPQNVHPVSG